MSFELIDPAQVTAMIDAEVDDYNTDTPDRSALLEEFTKARETPTLVSVNFSGGITQMCYAVTRPVSNYRVIYMPLAGYFSLCVESVFGPLDIGVHGPAIDCYASV